MKNALFYEKQDNRVVKCNLCPHYCIIAEGKRGFCRVRKNVEGDLYTEVYGKLAALGYDPIEKKPLYHFYPGSRILSVGTVGCNMRCMFCQNYEISQSSVDDYESNYNLSPDDIIQMAEDKADNIGIAYTYNEPFVFYEYVYETAVKAKKLNLLNVMVTNGYVNPEPLKMLLPYIDAFNVDLKSFEDSFYKKITKTSLQPVLKTIKTIHEAGKHLELTNLIIPTLNDDYADFEEMVKWISEEVSPDIPLHLSRYFPHYLMDIEATPVNILVDLYDIATRYLNYVYLGNVVEEGHSDTYCPHCGEVVISRSNYYISTEHIGRHGECSHCGNIILHYWNRAEQNH